MYLVNEAARLTTLIEDLNNKIADTQTRYTKAYSEYTEQYATYMEKLQDVDNSIMIAKAKNQIYDENQEQIDEMRGHLIVKQKEHDNVLFEISVIQAALKVLKSGDIQKDLLTTFVAVLNLHLAHFTQYVNIDYIVIRAVANKASVAFEISDTRFSKIVSVHTLSGGERTRLRLIVLLSMLRAIKELTAISSNLLVFDESLDTLDVSASKDLANLFDYLIGNDNKFIALVSHGDQLSDINFNGIITATKSEGVTGVLHERYS